MKRRQGLRGICCSNQIPPERNWRVRYFEGGHPLPSEGSFAAARATLALLRKARKDTLVLFLISGGASALFDLPLDPEISLEDTMVFHQALIASGAPITEVNTVRKHFSAVKGGRLAIAAPESTKISILLPDVPLRSLDTLASGPTSPDHTTVEEAQAILAKYDLLSKFPASVRAFFERADMPESPGNKSRLAPFLPRLPWIDRTTDRTDSQATQRKAIPMQAEDEAFRNSIFEVLLSSHDLVENARAEAQKLGYHTVVDNSCDVWDYADAARYQLDFIVDRGRVGE
jgi:hydroxypyruvate reductase